MVREIQLFSFRVPVEPDAVPHAARYVLEASAVRVEPRDIRIRLRRQADIAGSADVEVELAVRPEGEELPPVGLVLRQGVDHDHGLSGIVEIVLDPLPLDDAVLRGDIERAIAECDAVGQIEPFGDGLDLTLAALVHKRVDVADHTARYEERALAPESHGASVVDPGRIQLDVESWWDLDLVERDLLGRQRRRRLWHWRQRRVLQGLWLPLLPGRRRLLR